MKDFPAGLAVKTPPAMQGTWVRPLIQEDPTCHRAAKPVCHTAEALALEGPSSATREAPQREAHTTQGESSPARHNQRRLMCCIEDPEQPK